MLYGAIWLIKWEGGSESCSLWNEWNASRLVGQARHWYEAHFWSHSDNPKLTMLSKLDTSFEARLGFSFFYILFCCHLTHNSHFSKKRLCPWIKFKCEKIFKIDIFIWKHVLDHSKSIPTKKILLKFFDFLVTNFSKNGYVPQKIFQREKIFKIDISVLEPLLDHSKSIPTKKIFFEKNSIFLVIFRLFGPKNRFFFNFEGRNFESFSTHFKRIVLWSFCSITCILTSIELYRLTRIMDFLTKNSQ